MKIILCDICGIENPNGLDGMCESCSRERISEYEDFKEDLDWNFLNVLNVDLMILH